MSNTATEQDSLKATHQFVLNSRKLQRISVLQVPAHLNSL